MKLSKKTSEKNTAYRTTKHIQQDVLRQVTHGKEAKGK